MSRTHLYRAVRRPRPTGSALLFALWLGAALVGVAAILPLPAALVPAGTGGAALARLIPLVGLAALATGLLVLAAESLAIRSRFRAGRVVCAVILATAGSIAGFSGDGESNMLHAADAAPAAVPTLAAARAAHAANLGWLALALVAAGGGLVCAIAALRTEEVPI